MQKNLYRNSQNNTRIFGFEFIFFHLQFVDDANVTTNEVKKFREQKMRKLKEQLKHLLEKKKNENISSSFDPFQVRKEQIPNVF